MNEKEKTTQLKPLSYCDLGVGYKCNYKCLMCKLWQNSPLCADNVLSIEQWKNVLTQIVDLPKKDGCMINFAGSGEALLRGGIFELIKHGREMGLKIHVITNGFAVNKDVALKMDQSGLESLSFSLDSLNSQTHDYLRGAPGAKDRVLKAIELIALHSPNTKMGINTVISGVNIKEVMELTKWVEDHDKLAYINFQAITQPFSFTDSSKEDWFEDEKNKFLWPEDKKAVNQTIDELIELKQKHNKIADSAEQLNIFREYFLNPLLFIKNGRCNLGKGDILIIDPAGHVSMCSIVGIIDNVKNAKPIRDIMMSPGAQEHKEKINECRLNCHLVVSCYYHEESS
ncbi:MAG: radical SAM protein [Candidatus Omnitrophica bacterium]|nr:radical SAM protein [Candidatus Omnitrophota bacterium]